MKNQKAWDRLYAKDETDWRNRTAKALNRGLVEEMDLCNLQVALVEMSKSERATVQSKMRVLMTHLLKALVQPSQHTRSWNISIMNSRQDLKVMFDLSKVLRTYGESVMAKVYPKAMKAAIIETGLTRAQFWDEAPFTFAQMLNDNYGIKKLEAKK
jgi:aconitase A